LEEGVIGVAETAVSGALQHVEREEGELGIAAAEVDDTGRRVDLGDFEGCGHGGLITDV
jgi:hypothetical protein